MENEVGLTYFGNEKVTVVWTGPGWYAPRREGAYDSQHIRYYQVDSSDGEQGLGTPVMAERPEELTE